MSYRRGKVRKSSMLTQEIQNQNNKNLRREGEKGILIKRNDQRNNIRKYPVTEEHVSVEFLVQWMKRDRHQSWWSDFRTPKTEVRASREKAETTFKKRELQTQDARRVEQCLYYTRRKCLALSYLPTQTINWMWVNTYLSDKQVLKKSPSKPDFLYQMSKYSERGKNIQKMVNTEWWGGSRMTDMRRTWRAVSLCPWNRSKWASKQLDMFASVDMFFT